MPEFAIGTTVFVLIFSLLFGLGVCVFCGCVCAHFAGKKGRNKTGYFFLGFFFNLLGIIIILLLDDLNMKGKKRRIVYEEYVEDDEFEYK